MSDILSRITNKIGDKNIVDKLSALSKSDLNSLLLEVFDRQANTLTATDILKSYQLNRFTFPSSMDPEIIEKSTQYGYQDDYAFSLCSIR